MTKLYVGAVLDRLPTHRYCEQLAFCEFAPRAPLPRVSTIRRWFFQRSFETKVGFAAPRQSFHSERGTMLLDAEARQTFDWIAGVGSALEATYILLPTGRELTPGARDRQRLNDFCAALGEASGRPIVWSPGGLWEPEAAAEQAARMEVGLSLDVLEHDPIPAETFYGRICAVGTRARLGGGHLEVAVQAVLGTGATTAFLSVDAEPPVKPALNLLNTAATYAEDDETLEIASPTKRPRT